VSAPAIRRCDVAETLRAAAVLGAEAEDKAVGGAAGVADAADA
jgi:hypothetical protein